MSQHRNLFDVIARHGNDEMYHPRLGRDFEPTDAPAGSPEKIAVLRRRMERGLPLWHSRDSGGHPQENTEEPAPFR